MNRGQIDIFGEIIVDNFAGGGGASTGIELALGRPVDIAINHDPAAILMHKTNHPYTRHYQESVWDIDPVEVCGGQKVGLAWFSPDCKHFSKAKGAALVDKKIRGLAWIVCRWAGMVRPRVIILENVEEFQTWGPVRKGKPVKKKAGETFCKWLSQIEALGYAVEYRELVAADYGAPTTRKRFFLVARCDGRPIVWPERTHAPADSDDVRSGKCNPWRSAAEIIDWSLPCPSIFASKQEIKALYGINAIRPLAKNTQKRIARGLDKFVLKNGYPFIIPVGYGERQGQSPRVHNIDNPLPTTVSSAKHHVCTPVLTAAMTMHNNSNAAANSPDNPIGTVMSATGQLLITPVMTAIGQTGQSGDRSYPIDMPTKTQVSKAEQCMIAPALAPYMSVVNHGGAEDRARDLREPHVTMTAKNGCGIVAPALIQYHAEQSDYTRGQHLERPLMAVDAANRYGLTAASLTKYYGQGEGQSVDDPLHTVTAKDREGVSAVFLSKYFAGGYTGAGADVERPLPTVTAWDHNALCAAHVAEFKGQDKGQAPDVPLRTITASAGEFGAVKTHLAKADGVIDLHHWPEVRTLLNEHCGYTLADDEILLLEIGGILWYISDIGLRMLTPRELYAAQGFPADYIIDRDWKGNAYNKTQQVARCGNAVPPPFAYALASANLPEYAHNGIDSMEKLEAVIAA